MPADDNELLEKLESALAPPAAEPSPSEVAALRRAVAEQASSVGPERVWPWRVAAGLAAAVVLLFVVVAPPLPEPLRQVAHGLGLPVDSVEVADAKSAAAELRSALDDGDRERAARASARLQRNLDGLEERDRRRLASRTDPLIERARSSGSGTAPVPGQPPPGARTTTTVPTSTRRGTSTSTSSTTTTTPVRTSVTVGGTSTTRP